MGVPCSCSIMLTAEAKNIEIFTKQCESRKSIMLPAFDAIEKIDFDLSFDECLQRANQLKADLLRLVL